MGLNVDPILTELMGEVLVLVQFGQVGYVYFWRDAVDLVVECKFLVGLIKLQVGF
jgi:hypothetical protein